MSGGESIIIRDSNTNKNTSKLDFVQYKTSY